ncbi:OmpA family protein [Algibacter pectinivorans]|uniref:WD40-like Beta Propeller Repeat n=1 Tax=Algibacter pectinivorans TaxID=870482 RepID=A0A1I1S8S0_9FLAO|nr:OmpA family protein [Algibacter pectinivorans]SFD42889.1 WD40-like Beta Propeller Repeat [Algibacter pectinivorans]
MKTNYLIIYLLIFTSTIFAQTKLADKFYSNYGFVKAAELYNKAIENGDDTQHNLTRLGDCYYNNSSSKEAIYWYEKAAKQYDLDAEHIFRYIQSLKSLGKYAEANKWMKRFIEIQNDDSRLKNYEIGNLLKYDELNKIEDSLSIKIKNLSINSENSDFGTFIYKNEFYFASARNIAESKKYGWNKEPFLDIYQVSVKEKEYDLEFSKPILIDSENINSDYHESNVTITNDGKTIYFTRDNVTKKNKLNFDKKGTTHLKIYKASLTGKRWGNIVELSINDDIYSTGHPALSPDNKKLYFVSDREGGFGATDIYEVDILPNNEFSEPKNLGPKINTEGREMFPFISKDSTLYFSSDGRLNLGLLDIFKSNIIKDSIAEPQNIGAPYNSGFDDFAYFIDTDSPNKRSYFSSNRPGGKGNDDIYTVYTKTCSQLVKGIARNRNDNKPLANVTIKLIDETGKTIDELITTQNGEYQFPLKCQKKYTITAKLIAFSGDQVTINTNDEDRNIIEQDLYLQSLIQGNQIVINPIYFDFNKWDIRTDAQYELENIVDVLRVNPNMIIKIEAHTDSRGRDAYNMKLSDKRAKATRDYIFSRGISTYRIESAIGFGESQLLNKCSNGVKCTEEEHQTNRRSYFYIVKK